jgi:hypothetical protein
MTVVCFPMNVIGQKGLLGYRLGRFVRGYPPKHSIFTS